MGSARDLGALPCASCLRLLFLLVVALGARLAHGRSFARNRVLTCLDLWVGGTLG